MILKRLKEAEKVAAQRLVGELYTLSLCNGVLADRFWYLDKRLKTLDMFEDLCKLTDSVRALRYSAPKEEHERIVWVVRALEELSDEVAFGRKL